MGIVIVIERYDRTPEYNYAITIEQDRTPIAGGFYEDWSAVRTAVDNYAEKYLDKEPSQ